MTETSIFEWLGATLIDGTFRSTLVLCSCFAAATLLRRRGAAMRAAMWSAALAAVLLVPLLVLAAPRIALPALELGFWPSFSSQSAGAALPSRVSTGSTMVSAPSAAAETPMSTRWVTKPMPGSAIAEPSRSRENVAATQAGNRAVRQTAAQPGQMFAAEHLLSSLSPMTLALGVWMFGLCVLVLRQGRSWLRARELCQQSELVEDARIVGEFERACQSQLGIGPKSTGESRGVPRLATHLELRSPAVAGLLHPTILLPREAMEWSGERLAIVFAHELQHVARRDLWWRGLAQLSCALHWMNPLSWIAQRALCLEQERACDQAVLATGTKPSEYARHLLDLAHGPDRLRAVAVVPLARRNNLETRLMDLLDTRHRRMREASSARANSWSRLRSVWLGGAALGAALFVSALGPRADAATTAAVAPQEPRSPSVVLQEMREVESSMSSVEVRLHDAEAEAEAAARMAEELEPTMEEFEARMEAVEAEMRHLEDEMDLAEDEFGLRHDELQREVEEALEPFEQEMEALEQQLRPFEEEFRSLEEEMTAFEHHQEEFERSLAPHTERIEDLARQLEAVQEERYRLRREAREAGSPEVGERDRRLEDLERRADALRAEMDSARDELEVRVSERVRAVTPVAVERAREIQERARPIHEQMAAVQERMRPVIEEITRRQMESAPFVERMQQLQERMRPYQEQMRAIHEEMRPQIEAMAERHAAAAPHFERLEQIAREMEPFAQRMGDLGRELHDGLVARIVQEMERDPATGGLATENLREAAEEVLEHVDGFFDSGALRLRIDDDELAELLAEELGLGEGELGALVSRLLSIDFAAE